MKFVFSALCLCFLLNHIILELYSTAEGGGSSGKSN
jgi:hypothetical protein